MVKMTEADYVELKRLKALKMDRALCDCDGVRGAFNFSGHIELATVGTLLFVEPCGNQPLISRLIDAYDEGRMHVEE